MTAMRKFTIRLGIYGAALAYLACDLFVFHGPLARRIERATSGEVREDIVAQVFNHSITTGQLERAVRERLWLEGRTVDGVSPQDLRLIRYAALDELIDHALLRVKAKANAPDLIVTDAEVDERLRRLASRFESRDEMETAMKSQGIATGRELRDRLAARIQQERYVESKVAPLAPVTEEEARAWFDEHAKELEIPERVEVRHIFLPTLDRDPDEVKSELQTAFEELSSGAKDFPTLAAELSEDPASKPGGGNLGWLTRDRVLAEFTAQVFELEEKKPTLLRTRLGWHIVEITGRKEATPRSFENARDEVVAALENVKRRQAAAEYRAALKTFEAAKIRIDHEKLAGGR